MLREEVETYRDAAPTDVDFRFVNADEHPDIARQSEPVIVPSILIVKRGRGVETLPNVTPADTLRQRVEQWLAT